MTGISSNSVVLCNIVSGLSSKPQKHRSLWHYDKQALNFHWQLNWTIQIHSLQTHGLHDHFFHANILRNEARYFQDGKEDLIRTAYLSVLSLQNHLPRAPATPFHPADSVCPSQDNHVVVLVETPRCCWFPSQENIFPPRPSRNSPAATPALILASFCLL